MCYSSIVSTVLVSIFTVKWNWLSRSNFSILSKPFWTVLLQVSNMFLQYVWTNLLYLTPVHLWFSCCHQCWPSLPPLAAQLAWLEKLDELLGIKKGLYAQKTCLIFPAILVDQRVNINSAYIYCSAYVLRPPPQQEWTDKKPFPLYLHEVELCSTGFSVPQMISTSLEDNWTNGFFHHNCSDVVKLTKIPSK